MMGSAKIYSSDYGSASTSNSGSPWGSMDGWPLSASQQALGLQLSPQRPIPPATRCTGSFGDVDRNARTLSAAMEDFKMNGFDSPYDPEENKPWRSLPNNLSGMGPPSSYLRQKSWPEPDRTPAPPLPRFSPEKPVRPASGLQDSARLASGLQESVRLASGMQDSARLVSVLQDSARLALGMQDSARLVSGLQDSVRPASGMQDSARLVSGLQDSARLASGSQDSARLALGMQDSARPLSGLQDSVRPASGLQDSTRVASGLQDSARVAFGLQDWPEVAKTSAPAVGNWEDLARELSTLSRSAGGREWSELAALPQWYDEETVSATPSAVPAGDATITAEQLRVLQSLPSVVVYALLRDLQQNRLEKRGKKRLPDECRFCKNNGERESYYRSHVLKDSGGRVRCPVLRAFVCRRCGAGGDRAHTIKYCPLSTEEERNQSAAMMRSVRMASGRRRTSSVLPTADANFNQLDLPPTTGEDLYEQWNQPLGPEWAALEQKLLL